MLLVPEDGTKVEWLGVSGFGLQQALEFSRYTFIVRHQVAVVPGLLGGAAIHGALPTP